MKGNAMLDRQIVMVGFLQAQNCSNYPASWRHQESAGDFMTPAYYDRIARALEAGKFHLAFFDDRLAMPDIYGADHAEAVRNGVRVVKMDPVPILATMAMGTKCIGLAATCSTTYYGPFHIARTFMTLDHMSGGRAAWNVVTSLNDSEAFNMGAAGSIEHDRRYDRADELMRAVIDLWGAWDDNAIVLDKGTGVFADPSKVRRSQFDGEWFQTKGTFTVPPSPQGHPVIIQAGQSGRGRRFAVEWGEVIFAILTSIEQGRQVRKEMRAEAEAFGRDPDTITLAPAIYVTVGETQSIAEDKYAYIDSLAKPIDGLALLSEALNFDFAKKNMDDPFTDDELNEISGLRGILDRVIRLSGRANPTLADFVEFSGRGTIREAPHFVGNPKQVADRLEEWFVEGACDGYVLAATHMPGAYEEFARYVVPELQRRGLYHCDYRGKTLRENLGLTGYMHRT
ncbi:MAG: Nitrilotriacetate monooxygenase component A [Alphaproteobacteria bacterium MarineAlpha4_Bin2]|nr:MAG: Nitrilotriacetate monooxygenase component A [Alphaproteobacteria bacterium MarineAlpha4_Bin2]